MTGLPANGWGTPLYIDRFSGTEIDTARWSVYDAPSKSPDPTFDLNTSVTCGELRLTGSVNGPKSASNPTGDVGAGVASTLDQTFGRWEARIRIDRGAGYSGAVIVWPKSDKWPDDGEVDVMEIPMEDRSSGYSVVHAGPPDTILSHHAIADFTAWHVVGVDWTSRALTYYLDGHAVWTVTAPRYVPTNPMHLTLQIDPTCWTGCRNVRTPKQVVMHVDWVAIFSAAGPA